MPIIEFNEIPESCLNGVPCVFGIDEAGRGPLLGPMVYGCAFWPVDEEATIAAYGFDDSKALTEAKRESLFARIIACRRIGYLTHSITAKEISADMLRRTPVSLNVISHDAAISMLEVILERGVRVEKVFVDTVGDPGAYQNKLQRLFNSGGGKMSQRGGYTIDFVVSKKADSLFKCVSAASIAAKVTRDRSIRQWVFDEPALRHIVPDVVEASSLSSSPSHQEDKKKKKKAASKNSSKPPAAVTVVEEKGEDSDDEGEVSTKSTQGTSYDIAEPVATASAAKKSSRVVIDDSDDDDYETKNEDHVANEGGPPVPATTIMATSASSSSSSSKTTDMDDDEIDEDDEAEHARMNSKTQPSSTSVVVGGGGGGAAVHRPAMKGFHPHHSGSGYPSDPATKAWIVDNFDKIFGWPSVVRFSWQPAVRALEDTGVAVDWGEDDDDETQSRSAAAEAGGGTTQSKLSSFFSSSSSSNLVTGIANNKGRSAWMRKRHIEPVTLL